MKFPIIKTKLLVPAINDNLLRRSDLFKKLKKMTDYQLTLIHSGAGYGKSTALALFLRDENRTACWYSLSSTDDDILPFLTYITFSIRNIHPTFGNELLLYMNEMDRYIREEETNLLCSLFINELLEIDGPLTIILDDFHQIDHSYTINSWMETFLRHIPSHIHLVISSRNRPSWKQLTKMKVSGQLLEITKEDLILSIEEVEILLLDNYDLELPESELGKIYQLTEGWVIALCLIAQQVPTDKDLLRLKEYSTLQDLFHYLAMEVFVKQPLMIQQFLEQVCILEELTEDICNEIIGTITSNVLLEQLVERNLFIQKIGDKQYRFHSLFKEFLETRLEHQQPGQFRILHEKAARFYEKKGLWETALNHYKKMTYFPAIGAILEDKGSEILETGKMESLLDYISIIPEDQIDRYEFLWFLKGEIYRYRSQFGEAEECYLKAYHLYEKKNNHIRMSQVLEGRAKIYLDTIQPYQAERLLYEAIKLRESSGVESPVETGRLYYLLAENLLNQGKPNKSEYWLNRAKSLDVTVEDSNLEARIFLRTGRFTEAKRLLMPKKESIPYKITANLPKSHRETNILLSLIEAFTGNEREAKELAQSGIQLGIKLKAPFVEACGWIRMGHSVLIGSKYDSSLAESCYETALEMMEKLQISRGKAEPLMGLCGLYGMKKDYERAIEAGKKALLETDKVKDYWLSSLINLSLGKTNILNDHLEEGIDYLLVAEQNFKDCQDSYGETLCHFWKAYIYFTKNQLEEFMLEISLFIKMVQIFHFEFLLRKRTLFGPNDLQVFIPMLIECSRLDIERPFATKLLQDMGMKSVESHPGYSIRILSLGPFRVWLGEKELTEKDWQRDKAKELFQLFITHPKQTFTKEEITQTLWPALDKQSGDRDFKVAMNALNNTLEPHRKARSTPFFIIRDGSSYGLNPVAAIELDTILFQDWIEAGLNETNRDKMKQYLEKSLRIYKGDYLPERRYEDWCISKREKLLVLFLRGAEKMAQLYVQNENYDLAIGWCEQILERDRTWEEAYRLLMYCYYRKNNRPKAMKWYEKCIEILEEELGVSPLEPTKHMYDMILESTKYQEQMYK
ncbi:BTAD domain-containing putative transcriptional regulator [Pseudoneobacillus sp. C159]